MKKLLYFFALSREAWKNNEEQESRAERTIQKACFFLLSGEDQRWGAFKRPCVQNSLWLHAFHSALKNRLHREPSHCQRKSPAQIQKRATQGSQNQSRRSEKKTEVNSLHRHPIQTDSSEKEDSRPELVNAWYFALQPRADYSDDGKQADFKSDSG